MLRRFAALSSDQTALDNTRRKGRFITLEGGEGTGKSTQVQRLVARLAAKGVETLATREPGGSPKAERLREIILSGAVEPLGPVAETLAFAAARLDHLDQTIRPALAEGCYVVCDRFIDSTVAYQGAARGLGVEVAKELNAVAVAGWIDLNEDDLRELSISFGHRKRLLKAIAALRAGKHVLCEKPLARTSSAARQILEVASSAAGTPRWWTPPPSLPSWPTSKRGSSTSAVVEPAEA